MATPNPFLKSLYRILGSITGLFALIAQYYLIIQTAGKFGDNWGEQTIRFFSYMTIWTNILMTLSFLIPLLFSKSRFASFFQKPVIESGIFVFALIVMVIYHFFLASIWNPEGLQRVVDISLHYIMPLLYVFYWILYGVKGHQTFKNSIVWLAYPLAYSVFVMLRGFIADWYPYPFIDVPKLGYASVLRNMVLIAVAYLIVGLIVIIIDKRLRRTGYISTT